MSLSSNKRCVPPEKFGHCKWQKRKCAHLDHYFKRRKSPMFTLGEPDYTGGLRSCFLKPCPASRAHVGHSWPRLFEGARTVSFTRRCSGPRGGGWNVFSPHSPSLPNSWLVQLLHRTGIMHVQLDQGHSVGWKEGSTAETPFVSCQSGSCFPGAILFLLPRPARGKPMAHS